MNIKSVLIVSIIVSLGAVASFGAVDIRIPLREAQAESYFAINGSKVIHIPDQLETTVSKRIGWMKELGILWDRSDLWWGTIQPERGKFDFTLTDKIIRHFEEAGIQLYPILCYGAPWFEEGKTGPTTDEERRAYADYVYKTVERYKDSITYWSIWNEPNILPFWSPEPNADDYAAMLKMAYKAAKKADPDCMICAPVVAPLDGFDRKFVERLYQLGCKDYFDVFDYHYYRSDDPEDEVPAEIAEIRALMRRYGDDKPIWISETGVPSPVKKKPESYERQAALVVRNHLLCLAAGVERIFYFDLQNWHDDQDQSWDSYLGLVEAGDTKKPAFYAYQTMVKEVDYKDVLGQYSGFGRGIESVLIHDTKHDEYILVVWLRKAGKRKDIEIICESTDIKIVEPYGNVDIRVLRKPALPGEVTRTTPVEVEVTQHPRFVHNVDKLTYLPEVGIKMVPDRISLTPGDRVKLELRIDPRLGDYKIIDMKTNAPDGLEWNQKKGSGYLKAEKNAASGKRTLEITAEVSIGGGEQGKTINVTRTVDVEIVPAVTLSLRPYMADDELLVQAAVSNRSAKSIKGRLRIEETGGKNVLGQTKSKKIKANEQVVVDIPIEKSDIAKIEGTASWRLNFGGSLSDDFNVYAAPLRKNGPVINGLLDEWNGVPRISIDRAEQIVRGKEGWTPENASAEIAMWFTAKSVCLAAWISDDDPAFNKNKPNELWKADSLELYLGFAGPTKRTVINKEIEFQLGLAPASAEGRPLVFMYHFDKIMINSNIAVKKTAGGYTIEAEIPLSEFGEGIGELSDGMLLGFDVGLDDLDKDDWAPEANDPGRAMMWNGTGMNWIDPSGWGLLILKE